MVVKLICQLLEIMAETYDMAASVEYNTRTVVLAQQIAGSAHEFRNSVAATRNELAHIKKGIGDLIEQMTENPIRDRLSQLQQDCSDAITGGCDPALLRAELLRQFRSKGKVRLSPSRFRLDDLIYGVIDSLNFFADDKKIQFDTKQVADDLPEIVSDKVLLSECVANLLLNAIYFTDTGRRIEVGSDYQPEEDLPIRLWIQDEGGGIHKSDAEKIFEPFFSTKPTGSETTDGSGTGLGLFLVKMNTTLLGGQVKLDSIVMKSSKFTICLPLSCEERPVHE